MNIATLKEVINDLPDDMLVLVPNIGFDYELCKVQTAYLKTVDYENEDEEIIENLEVLILEEQ